MPRRLSSILLGALLCAPLLPAAQKADPPTIDPRLGVLNLKYGNAKGKELVEFDLVNRASAPIVYWVAVLRRRVISTRRSPAKNIGVGAGVEYLNPGNLAVIEPGGQLHLAITTGCSPIRQCSAPEFYGVTALFADGSWAGEWAFVESQVKFRTIRWLVVQQWLVSLRALLQDRDPVASVVSLLRQLERLPSSGGGWFGIPNTGPRSLASLPWVDSHAPPDEMARQNIDHLAGIQLQRLAQRCYGKMLMLDRREADPRKWRDQRAEKALKSRADAMNQLPNRIAEEIALVELELEVTAWVNMFGPNGERVGPAVPPPAPTAASLARWRESMRTGRLPPPDSALPALKTRPDR